MKRFAKVLEEKATEKTATKTVPTKVPLSRKKEYERRCELLGVSSNKVLKAGVDALLEGDEEMLDYCRPVEKGHVQISGLSPEYHARMAAVADGLKCTLSKLVECAVEAFLYETKDAADAAEKDRQQEVGGE
jgi:hypothetical protein